MFKAVLFICLCVAVLSVSGQRNQKMSKQAQGNQRRGNSLSRTQMGQNRPQTSQNRAQFGSKHSQTRMVRQLPQMPGMNPAEIPKLMTDGIQKGVGVMTNMMDPGKWMQAASQMIPKSNDS
ncbi:uncharacterized protein LOC122506194 [Leptopilina heterotoma]|uniref:uncharacterized protein LOC122506194 n=1 Tax=Leptopilina heterotoma TaxID=63436 RepID=UPI001CA94829|nr:uncharacterized protein LOC122506194 [Leptopilina heterotoma]